MTTLQEALYPLLTKAQRVCRSKHAYRNEVDALEVVRKRLISSRETPEELHAYLCFNCRKWHLTRFPQAGE